MVRGVWFAGFVVTVVGLTFLAVWWQDENRTNAKPLGWLELFSWISGTLGLPVGIIALVVGWRGARKARPPVRVPLGRCRRVSAGRVIGEGVPAGRDEAAQPKWHNRDKERGRLMQKLVKEPGDVVVVHGDRGVGKSRLVAEVLKALPEKWRKAHDEAGPEISTYRAGPDALPLLDSLIADLGKLLGEQAEAREALDLRATSLDRLKAGLEALGTTPVVIVIEQVEHLLDPAGEFHDAELAEALDIIATDASSHRVTVLLVTRVVPRTPIPRTRPASHALRVGPLSSWHFGKYLNEIDKDRRGLKRAVGRHRGRLRGDLRLAELAYQVLDLPEWDARKLGAALRETANVSQFLAGLLLENVGPLGRRVLEALDAFGTPVDAADVCELLQKPPDKVGVALKALADAGIVWRTAAGQYHLPPGSDDWSIDTRPQAERPDAAGRSKFFREAAAQLKTHFVKSPATVADLRYDFAELRAYMRAGRFTWAYDSLQTLDKTLRDRWNAAVLLLDQREALRKQPLDEDDARANENALGDLYASRGDFEQAARAYGDALARAEQQGDLYHRTLIRANLAGAYWWNGNAQHARIYYELVLDDCEKLAREHDGLAMVCMGALEGLANCEHFWGRYDPALELAGKALRRPDDPRFPGTDEARDFATGRSSVLAMRMARWNTELGRRKEADELVALAGRKQEESGQEWTRTAYHNGLAEIWLLRGDYEQARIEADKALELALRYGDPTALPMARTVLCAAHLLKGRGDCDEAARQIRALRYRPDGALVVQALRGLVALALGEPDGGRDASQIFEDLRDETARRLRDDPQDVMALDYQGFALCGLLLNTDAPLKDAIGAFEQARAHATLPTPNLDTHFRRLLERLDRCAGRPGRLRPVIEILSAAQPLV
jgi:tetratricopeptide (TPR) repeat protein